MTELKILPQSFETWRSDILENCDKRAAEDNKFALIWQEFQRIEALERLTKLSNIPKTLIRLTRQLCECREDCTQHSLANLYYQGVSPIALYAMKNDDNYYSADLISLKVVNGTLVESKVKVDGENLRREIINLLKDLCNDKKGSLRLLKCKAYELKDQCGGNLECQNEITRDTLPENFRTCLKPEFSDDLSNIGLKINDLLAFKQVRVERNLQYFDDTTSFTNSASRGTTMGLFLTPPLLIGMCLIKASTQSSKYCIGYLMCIITGIFFVLTIQ